jgi:hypothetical protein
VTELGEHSADLAILAFRENHLQDRRFSPLADDADSLGSNLALGEPDSFRELVENLFRGVPRHDNLVDLLDAEFRMRELVGEFPVVGEEDQPRARFIESSNRVDTLSDLGKEIQDARSSGGVVVGRDVTLGLVDREVDMAFLADALSVDGDLGFAYLDLGPEFANDLSIDGHATLEDEFLTRSS